MKRLWLLIILMLAGIAFSANEVVVNYESGKNLYFIIREADGLDTYDTTGDDFEVWNVMADYDIALTDKEGSCYTADFEDQGEVVAGIYIIQAFERVGDTADDDDPFIGSEDFIWSGTAETVIDIAQLNTHTAITAAAIWAVTLSDLADPTPDVNASVLVALNWLYEAWRNKVETDVEYRLFKDDGVTPLVERDIEDVGGVFTRDEIGAPD